jgi:hypothetical protein
MRRLRAFGLFWWDFIVGDDYRLALGVVVLLALTAVLSRAGIESWWLLPGGVLAILGVSVFSVARRSGRARPADQPRRFADEPGQPTGGTVPR